MAFDKQIDRSSQKMDNWTLALKADVLFDGITTVWIDKHQPIQHRLHVYSSLLTVFLIGEKNS